VVLALVVVCGGAANESSAHHQHGEPLWAYHEVVPGGGTLRFLRDRVSLWVMMPSSVATATMVPFFARHYEGLGVDMRRVTVLLHRDRTSQKTVDALVAAALLRAFDVDVDKGSSRVGVVPVYSSDVKRDAVNRWLRTLPEGDFVVYADLDEFFEYPRDLEAQIQNKRQFDFVGFMMERVGTNFTFPALRDIREGVAIEDQFPLKCRTRAPLKGNDRKHTLFRVVDRRGTRRQFQSSHRFDNESKKTLRRRPGVDFARGAAWWLPVNFFFLLARSDFLSTP